jgi:pimeloyl-ACP methyl ester carboxylesterase
MSDKGSSGEFKTIQGAKLEVVRRGHGAPLLLLLSEESWAELSSPFVSELATKHQLIIPQFPGFGRSERPDWVSSPDDIAYMVLDFLDGEGIRGIPVVGLSLGGWVALEMAIKDRGIFSKIALVDPLGVKIGGPLDRDFQDIWTLHPEKVAALKWHDPAKGKRDFSATAEDEVTIYARNIESFARFCWDPYMHNPKLKVRLGRVNAPTLVLWGENDGVATPTYGKAFANAIHGATFDTIAAAGHYPQLEQPAMTLKRIETFLA